MHVPCREGPTAPFAIFAQRAQRGKLAPSRCIREVALTFTARLGVWAALVHLAAYKATWDR